MQTHTTRSLATGLPGSKWTSTGELGRDLVSLEGFAGTVVHCTAGTLWLTLEGDFKDYILTPGKTVFIPDSGKVLLSGAGAFECLSTMELGAS